MIGRINSVFSGINFFTCGAVEIDYSLDLVGSISANLSLGGSYHGVDGADINLSSDMPIKIGIESSGHIKYSLIKTEGGASVTASAMANFRVIIANDNRNGKYAGELYFEGLTATFTVKKFRKKKVSNDNDERTKKTVKLEDGGRDNEAKVYPVTIMDPWTKPIKFPFFD